MTMSARGWPAAAVGALAAIALAGAAATALHHRTPPPSSRNTAAEPLRFAVQLPHPARPAFTPRRPVQLAHPTAATRSAPVLRSVEARSAPKRGASVVASLLERTPDGTSNIVLVTGEAGGAGREWVRVALPVLPNGSIGWIPRDALGGYSFATTRLEIDRHALRARLYRDGRLVFEAPVGVGKDGSPTPPGRFYIREKLAGFGNPFYGPVAFGTNARSAVLTDWPGGGFIGIHGTNEPQLIPGRISHGCIRLRNPDILRLARLMPVGTPVTVK
jgi:hypothetical protein